MHHSPICVRAIALACVMAALACDDDSSGSIDSIAPDALYGLWLSDLVTAEGDRIRTVLAFKSRDHFYPPLAGLDDVLVVYESGPGKGYQQRDLGQFRVEDGVLHDTLADVGGFQNRVHAFDGETLELESARSPTGRRVFRRVEDCTQLPADELGWARQGVLANPVAQNRTRVQLSDVRVDGRNGVHAAVSFLGDVNTPPPYDLSSAYANNIDCQWHWVDLVSLGLSPALRGPQLAIDDANRVVHLTGTGNDQERYHLMAPISDAMFTDASEWSGGVQFDGAPVNVSKLVVDGEGRPFQAWASSPATVDVAWPVGEVAHDTWERRTLDLGALQRVEVTALEVDAAGEVLLGVYATRADGTQAALRITFEGDTPRVEALAEGPEMTCEPRAFHPDGRPVWLCGLEWISVDGFLQTRAFGAGTQRPDGGFDVERIGYTDLAFTQVAPDGSVHVGYRQYGRLGDPFAHATNADGEWRTDGIANAYAAAWQPVAVEGEGQWGPFAFAVDQHGQAHIGWEFESLRVHVAPPSLVTQATFEFTGTGGGSIRSQPPLVDCDATCTVEIPRGMALELFAEPDEESRAEGFVACPMASCPWVFSDEAVDLEVRFARGSAGSVVSLPEVSEIDYATIAPDGDTYVFGRFAQQADIGGITVSGTGGASTFLARFTADGDVVWAHALPGEGALHVRAAAVTAGALRAVGTTTGPVDAGGGLIGGVATVVFAAWSPEDGSPRFAAPFSESANLVDVAFGDSGVASAMWAHPSAAGGETYPGGALPEAGAYVVVGGVAADGAPAFGATGRNAAVSRRDLTRLVAGPDGVSAVLDTLGDWTGSAAPAAEPGAIRFSAAGDVQLAVGLPGANPELVDDDGTVLRVVGDAGAPVDLGQGPLDGGAPVDHYLARIDVGSGALAGGSPLFDRVAAARVRTLGGDDVFALAEISDDVTFSVYALATDVFFTGRLVTVDGRNGPVRARVADVRPGAREAVMVGNVAGQADFGGIDVEVAGPYVFRFGLP